MNYGNNDKVILFPGWKDKLENDSKQALKEKRYKDALAYLNQLTDHDIETHEVLTGKLICFIELGEFELAEDLCLELLAKRDEHYFDYVHIYTTLLFQASQYHDLLDLLDDVFEKEEVPEPIKTQLWQVYGISKKLSNEQNNELGSQFIKDLKRAVSNNDVRLQWGILQKCRKVDVSPHLPYLKDLLVDSEVNPVVKTAILQWLQDQAVEDEIEVHKLKQKIRVVPASIQKIEESEPWKHVLNLMDDIEQDNPSLFDLISKLLYRYMYVSFPLGTSKVVELQHLATALRYLGVAYLQLPNAVDDYEEEVKQYISDIEVCEKVYFSVIDE